MPKYRWIKNRNCGWLIKSVIINLVMKIKRITLLIVEQILELDI